MLYLATSVATQLVAVCYTMACRPSARGRRPTSWRRPCDWRRWLPTSPSSRDGTDTLIGPRGLRLSGGQRQRLGAARALVHAPELVVLDDLSSAVDVETELALWENLATTEMTVIAVSHRAVALERADRVLRMEEGRFVSPVVGAVRV